MDYKQEQEYEMEALESIFPNEFKKLQDLNVIYLTPVDSTALDEVTLKDYQGDVLEEEDVGFGQEDEVVEESFEEILLENVPHLLFLFRYPEEYPEVPLEFSIKRLSQDPSFIHSKELVQLYNDLRQLAEENVGMVHVFTLISHARDYLEYLVKLRKEEVENDRLERIKSLEEAEKKRTEGTKVTPESFKEWKLKFDKEKLKNMVVKTGKKITGRQLFEQNKGLSTSDITEDSKDVVVDMTLFELEELGLDDDGEDSEEGGLELDVSDDEN